jgi:hypothetical protein
MKAVFVVILFAASAFGQETSGVSHAQTACGPFEVRFDTETSTAQPPAQPEPGKALIFVAEDFNKAPGELGNPTIRIGLDGAWKGATRASSYLFFAVDPGEHHLCASWQSHLKRLSKLASFAILTADAGKTYYYRARITYVNAGAEVANMNLDLEPVNSDEGKYLVASFQLSTSHPKR